MTSSPGHFADPHSRPSRGDDGRHYADDKRKVREQSDPPSLHERASTDEPPAKEPRKESGERAPAVDGKLQVRITKGEGLVKEGQLAAERGSIDKAYERYCRGLQYLLDVMPKLNKADPGAAALRSRINSYLEEAEKLKTALDAVPKASGVPTEREEEPANVEKTHERRASGSGIDLEHSSVAADVLRSDRPGDGGTSDGKLDPFDGQDKAATEEAIRSRIEDGESLIREGKAAESKSSLEEAYDKYCRGLQYLLEVMPRMSEDSAHVAPLRTKISSYLEQAESLKDRLESATGAPHDGPERGVRLTPAPQPPRREVSPAPAASSKAPPSSEQNTARNSRSRHRHRDRRSRHRHQHRHVLHSFNKRSMQRSSMHRSRTPRLRGKVSSRVRVQSFPSDGPDSKGHGTELRPARGVVMRPGPLADQPTPGARGKVRGGSPSTLIPFLRAKSGGAAPRAKASPIESRRTRGGRERDGRSRSPIRDRARYNR